MDFKTLYERSLCLSNGAHVCRYFSGAVKEKKLRKTHVLEYYRRNNFEVGWDKDIHIS